MLEVAILKVSHGGKDIHDARKNAEKLFPYIKWCDIYAPEYAGATEDLAINNESRWEELLATGNHSKFKKREERVYQSMEPAKSL